MSPIVNKVNLTCKDTKELNDVYEGLDAVTESINQNDDKEDGGHKVVTLFSST